jgi:hypothetical protein
LNLSNNTNFFEVGINLIDLGNPTKIDIVSANISSEPDSTYWDWAPSDLSSHRLIAGWLDFGNCSLAFLP